jgi:hypothetical protein
MILPSCFVVCFYKAKVIKDPIFIRIFTRTKFFNVLTLTFSCLEVELVARMRHNKQGNFYIYYFLRPEKSLISIFTIKSLVNLRNFEFLPFMILKLFNMRELVSCHLHSFLYMYHNFLTKYHHVSKLSHRVVKTNCTLP